MATIDSQTDSELVLSDWEGSNRSRASRYLDKRLAETSSNYKSVVVATFLLKVAIAGFGWLLFGIFFERDPNLVPFPPQRITAVRIFLLNLF